jgi:hypothetical protein
MIRLAELKKIALFGLFGALGCLCGWVLGEPLLAIGLPDASVNGTPSLVSRTSNPVPPPEFKERLENTGARTGDVQISLIWDGRHDLDLHCVAPGGEDIYFNYPRSRSGGQLDVDSNAGCEKNIRDKPVENIVWAPGTAPEGEYQVYVDFYVPCPREVRFDATRKDFETPFKVRLLSDGEERIITKSATYVGGRDNKVLIDNFRVGPKIKITAPAEAAARTGKSLELPFRLTRVNTPGQATVAAVKLPEGVKAEAVVVPAGETEGKITLLLANANAGTSNIELSVNADGRTASATVALTLAEGGSWSLRMIAVLAVWTALLACGLAAALVIGQNRYTGRPWSSGKLPLAAAGAAGAGAISGAVGQTLLFVFASISLGGVGFFAGWLLLGALLGFGVSFFIPNLDRKKATLAGLLGGGFGAAAFLLASPFAEWAGRVVGAAILGFFIGLMVALVEVAFRRAWLEVRFGGGETITVNLGPEPVKVGDDRSCTVWARGAAAVALRYWIRDGRVICDDGGEKPVGDGDRRQAGAVTLTVRTGAGVMSPAAPPPVQVAPRPIPPRAAPVVSPPVQPPPPPPPPLASKPSAPPPASKPVMPPRPVPSPPVAAPKPAVPPPAPPPPSKPMAAPIVPKPAAPVKPASPAAPGTGCPTCGRSAAGASGKRYCMVCDHSF